MRTINFTNIDWDSDKRITNLPTEVTLLVEDDDMDISLEGADLLSDAYGYCVNSFSFTAQNN